MKKLLFLLLLVFTACECPYADYEFNRKHYKYYDGFYAEKLLGEWQCYYPMFISNVEFKSISFYNNGYADIVMAIPGQVDRFTQTFAYSYYGNTLRFARNGSNFSFTIVGYEYPELYLKDSFGEYTWRKVRSYGCGY